MSLYLINETHKDKILENLNYVSSVLSNCDDWVDVKKMLLLSLPSNLRSYFSVRHNITKEQNTNQLEHDLIQEYKEICGVKLVIRGLKERRELKNE